jgi:hypothetical protein
VDTLADTVDLFVHFRTVMVTLLTGASNRVLDTGRMPCSNTSDLAETLVGLARKLTGMPTRSDT